MGTNTLRGDLQRWWYNLRGLPDPTLMIGQENTLSASRLTPHASRQDDFVWALKDINFEVKQGEVLGIIGKNGAGKSTLLKLLSRVTAPTTGNIKVKGRIASLLEVGTGFHPELTGRENIFLNGAILGMTKIEIRSKFDEIVDFAGVAKYIDTPVKRYSSGMYVRLAFAVAAHLEPEILIVDEVLAVGDAEFQKKAIGKMQDVSKNDGRTVLFVSHNMTAVKSLCQKGMCLKNGSIDNYGEVESVIDNYLKAITLSGEVYIQDGENEKIKVESIKIRNNVTGYFDITETLLIDIFLINKSSKGLLNINLFFNNPDGTLIFATCSDVQKIPIGEFKCTCNIPSKFLNDNIYILDIMVVENEQTPILHLQSIMMIEGIEPKREGSWLGKFPGEIKPNFKWAIEYE
jgi:lipopolysaccharide transport system ATP-binding protein